MPYLRRVSTERPASRQRGSVLVVTLIFATGVALSIGSFLAISLNSAKLSRQSFQANGALNLAEAGLELAFSAMNEDIYTGWSVNSAHGANSRYMVVNNIDLSQGITGQIRVMVYNVTTVTRRIVAEGIATPVSGPSIRKQISIQAKRRSIFATGLVSKDQTTFDGNNVSVDSWNSDPGDDDIDIRPYSSAIKQSNGSVASTAVTVTIGQADVWGYVATGRDQPNVGNNGTIAAYSSPQGTKDPDRITTDFKHNFEPIDVPVPTAINTLNTIGASDVTLPDTTNHNTGIDQNPNGDKAPKYYYDILGVDLSGKVLDIRGDVVFLMRTGSGATAVSVSGQGAITINQGSTLAIYTQGDIAIAGKGIVNNTSGDEGDSQLTVTNQAEQVQIYGTNTSVLGQDIKIAGNGVLSAVCYAPNADLQISGGGNNGHVCGAFVAKTIKITGNSNFHYDENLKNFGEGNPFELQSWIELFGSNRVTF